MTERRAAQALPALLRSLERTALLGQAAAVGGSRRSGALPQPVAP